MILTDTHTHLYLEQFDEDRVEMIQRAFDKGVQRIFLPNIDSSTTEAMLELRKEYPSSLYTMMGLHPCSVKPESYKKELQHVVDGLDEQPHCAVGEIGIDLYWDKTTLDIQVEAFQFQVEQAIERNLPVAIHCRDSFDEIVDALSPYKGKVKGVFHCFTGSLDQAKVIMDFGLYLGIGGVLTFKNSGLDHIVKDIPLSKIVLETDAPYLTPVPYRGKRNESAYIYHVAEKLADIKGVSIEEIATITTDNSIKMFEI